MISFYDLMELKEPHKKATHQSALSAAAPDQTIKSTTLGGGLRVQGFEGPRDVKVCWNLSVAFT
jgi:hypothetical protein